MNSIPTSDLNSIPTVTSDLDTSGYTQLGEDTDGGQFKEGVDASTFRFGSHYKGSQDPRELMVQTPQHSDTWE